MKTDRLIDPSTVCTLWESQVISSLREKLGDTVPCGEIQKKINGIFIRAVIKAHKIPTPSPLYFRPDKAGSRAMYSQEFVEWMVERYHEDPDFFYKARLAAEGKSAPEPSTQSMS